MSVLQNQISLFANKIEEIAPPSLPTMRFEDDFAELDPEQLPTSQVTLRPYQIDAVDAICNTTPDIWRQLLVLATGGGKCVTPDTLIWSSGLKTMGEAFEKAHHLAGPHKRDKITAWYDDGVNNGYKICTAAGLEINGTAEHRVWIRRDDGFEGWCTFTDIKRGDYVAIGRGRADFGTNVIPLDEAYALGLTIADGCLIHIGRGTDTGWRLQIDKQRPVLHHIEPILECWRKRGNGRKDGAVRFHDESAQHAVAMICAPDLDIVLARLGFRGEYSQHRYVPQPIKNGTREVVTTFLRGYFDGDGYCDKNVCVSTSSQILAREVQALLLGLGIYATIRTKHTTHLDAHIVTIRDIVAFHREIGMSTYNLKKDRSYRLLLALRSNTNIDIVPGIGKLLQDLASHVKSKHKNSVMQHIRNYYDSNKRPSYETLKTWLDEVGGIKDPSIDELRRLFTEHRAWSPVISKTRSRAHRIDCEVKGSHAFIGNGIVNHNTICFADLIKRVIPAGKRALVLAHRDELIRQAQEKILWYHPLVVIEREKAEQRASRTRLIDYAPNVVMGSVQSLHAKRLAEFPRDAFDLIVCDESHHAANASYRAIFEHFGCFDDVLRTPLVGVTATPDRSDNKPLTAIFQREAYRKDLPDLISEGWLADVRAKSVVSTADLSKVPIVQGDFDQQALEQAVDSAERNALIVQSYVKYAAERKCLVFAASVAHAQHLADLFTRNNISCAAIWGAMDKDLRRERLKDFKTGKIQVLTNCFVLSEGYDEPTISCIILARPTRSRLMLIQIIGRGTRLHETKDHLLVLDIRDQDEKDRAMSVAGALGLPNNFIQDDATIVEDAEMFKDIPPALRDKVLDHQSLRKIHEHVKNGLDAQDYDILERRQTQAEIAGMSKLRWNKSGEDAYALHVSYSTQSPDGKKTHVRERYTLEPDSLGQWQLHWLKGNQRQTSTRAFPDIKDAFSHYDPLIEQTYSKQKIEAYIRNDAEWVKQPVSPKQVECLFAYGVFKDPTQIPTGLTRDEAGTLIDRAAAAGSKFSFRRVPQAYRTREVKARPENTKHRWRKT